MPIIDLQRRHAELGRIRLGAKKTSANGKSYPSKLDKFRFTSPSERFVLRLAELYGGEARPWDNGGKKEWEVYTEANSIPVAVVQGGLTQWMETWSGGGCIHRCDGRHNVLTDAPCDPQDRAHIEAKPTTRLSVMLRELDAIGVWRLETHGWNAAVELPTNVDLASMVGSLVKANLTLHERTAIRDGKTSRFVVPGLDLEVAPAQLIALASGGATPAGIGAAVSAVPQLESAPVDFAALVEGASTADELRALWHQAGESGCLDEGLKTAFTARSKELLAENSEAAEVIEATVEPDDEVSDSEDSDGEAEFTAMLAAAGKAGWETNEVTRAFEVWAALPIDEASPSQLVEFTGLLKSGQVERAVA